MSSQQIHRRYVFHGRVQAVGFRMTTERIARRYTVVGYVKNLADGTVEMVITGSSAEIESVLSEIDRALPGNVSQRDVEELDAAEEFDSFTIRY